MLNSSYKIEDHDKEVSEDIALVKHIKFEEVIDHTSGELYGFRQIENNDSQFECEYCPSTFFSVSELEEHVWEHHSINNETINEFQNVREAHSIVDYTDETKEFALSHSLKEQKDADKPTI